MPQVSLQHALAKAIERHRSGQLAEAKHLYSQILAARPDEPDALHLLGVLELQSGDTTRAIELIQNAIARNPASPAYYSNLGQALAGAGQITSACDAYRKALTIDPNLQQAWWNFGAALLACGNAAEAVFAANRSAELMPDSADAFALLGRALLAAARPAEAIAPFSRALTIRADDLDSIVNLGSACKDSGEPQRAIELYRKALQQRPDWPEAQANLADAFRRADRLSEASDTYEKVLLQRPGWAELHNDLGSVRIGLGDVEGSQKRFQRAVALDPHHARAHYNLAFVHLLNGDYSAGWREHEWRWKRPEMQGQSLNTDRPIWDGAPLKGRRILIHNEQGFGDVIQFIRYAPLLAERGASVIVRCQPQLKRLLQNIAGVSEVIADGEPLPDFDLHCPLLGLPMRFGTTLETIPASVPYLRARDELVDRWKQRLPRSQGKTTIGLAWRGRAIPDPHRSISPELLAPLAQIQNATFVQLHQADSADATGAIPQIDVNNFVNEFTDFADVAAVMHQVDLVLTIDTAVAHLAGAMGKKTMILLPFASDWRWLRGRDDSPWYPTAKLFRQTRRHDWSDPIMRAIAEIAAENK
jgi:tetratricopeptide (TPR) repeat protein